jgi:NitT/TauT family transport system substrate-binding protein
MSHNVGNAGASRRLAATVLCGLSLAVIACGDDESSTSGGETSSEAATKETIDVVLPSPSIMAFFPFWVAESQGFFEEEGLDVNVNAADGGSAMMQLFAAGEADVIEGDTNSVLTAAGNLGFRPVMFLRTWSGTPIGVYGGPDGGITGPQGLKGKTVGVGNVTDIEATLTKATAASGGVNPDDVEILAVGGAGQAVAAFERGDIQAFAGGIQDVALIQARGLQLTRIDAEAPLFYMGSWASQEDLADRPEAYQGFVRAMKRSWEHIGEDPEKLMEWARSVDPTAVPPGESGAALARTVIDVRYPEPPDQLGGIEAAEWEQAFARVKEEAEGLDGEPSDYYTTEFVSGNGSG